MKYIISFLAWVMGGCYKLCGIYGLAIILFTFLSKIILLPVSVWVQKNSIKMVKMQPDINFMKAKFYGDKDTIAEEQAKIFKKEGYSPLVTVIPLFLQLLLLMGVIEVIKIGIADPAIHMIFCGMDLRKVPSAEGVAYVWSPILAALSAWIMCEAQNRSNVLQSEQAGWNKYGTMIFSVALSLYLGWFVSIGVALYWVVSNLLSVAQLYLLNWAINPAKYVDYERLEESKRALAELSDIGHSEEPASVRRANAKREKADYKRFFGIVNKHLVFYSESSGFYKYYKGIIEYLLDKTNLTIHYITSDPKDAVFELAKTQTQIKPYYIGEKRLITLMMKMDADVVVMTMPDIENYHIKRSYIRKDIRYVYIPHCIDSLNMTMRTGSVDHYDAVLLVGPHHRAEIEETEKVYGLPKKELIDWGYCLLDEMIADYRETASDGRPKVLIAPSWQADNIVDSCLEPLLESLRQQSFDIIVRPHPQHVRHKGAYFETLKQKYAEDGHVTIQTDFTSNDTVFNADLMITDWSGITYEYAFTTKKPVLFVNTPMKIMNEEYTRIPVTPINIQIREEIGVSIDVGEIEKAGERAAFLLENRDKYREKIEKYTEQYIYNLGSSAEVGAKYLIKVVQEQIKQKKEY